MKNLNRILWGVVLIALGVVFALNALNVVEINIFFEGWWTLFIIVPCAIGLITEREKTGNLIGVAIGVFLLLCCRDVLPFNLFWKLLIPAIIVLIGLKLVFSGMFRKDRTKEIFSDMEHNGSTPRVCCAAFSGSDLNYNGEVFEGADLTAVFGGIKCDLRQAVFEKDAAIKVSAIFGGIDILVPDNITVKVNSTSIFGGVSNKVGAQNGAVTLYISGGCVFGGVDIK